MESNEIENCDQILRRLVTNVKRKLRIKLCILNNKEATLKNNEHCWLE